MRTWTVGACMAALLGLAPAAQAATVSSSGARISVTGGVKVDTVTVAAGDEQTRVEDSTAPLTAQTGCVQVNAHVATCPANFDVDIAVDLRDGDDTATVDGGGTVDVTAGTGNDTVAVNHPFRVSQVHGGAGDDHLTMGSTLGGALFGEDGDDDLEVTSGAAGLDGGPGDDRLVGGAGNDSLSAGPGDDQVLGEDGDDYIDADDGADDISGGNGNDWLLYHGGVANVTLDDVADDGAPGEGDNVHSDVENVDARDAISTRIVGDDAANQLLCWTTCTIDGGGGDDILAATYQASLDGGDGDDRFQLYVPYSGGGIDMHGGPGSDTVEELLSDRSLRVSISLDDQANDGVSGSVPSNVHSDVENVIGGDGPDQIRGDDASNTLVGGGGDDVIQPGLGADTVSGGAGYDELDYSALTAAVRVSLDWVADDGAGGAGGNVLPDIEAVYGGKGDDDLRAGAAPGGVVLDGGRATTSSSAARATTTSARARGPTRSPAARARTSSTTARRRRRSR